MREGLLWYDDDPGRDLAQKVGRAAQYYKKKFGRKPNVCYVHPSQEHEDEERVGSVAVSSLSSVLRHHFWLGEEEQGN